MNVQSSERRLARASFSGSRAILSPQREAEVEPANVWYRHYELTAERSRGLDHEEDHLHAATFHSELSIGESVTLSPARTRPRTLDGAIGSSDAAARNRATASMRAGHPNG